MHGPNCDCGIPARHTRVTSDASPNKGRYFWGCSRYFTEGPDSKCKFFKWADEEDDGDDHGTIHYNSPTPARALPRSMQSPGDQSAARRSLQFNGSQSPSPGGYGSQGQHAIIVTFHDINQSTFGISFRPYDEAFKDHVKNLVASRTWDSTKKQWIFQKYDYQRVLSKITQTSIKVRVLPLPASDGRPAGEISNIPGSPPPSRPSSQQQQRQQQTPTSQPMASPQQQPTRLQILPEREVNARIHRLPKTTWDRLYPFQQECVRFGVSRGGRFLLADEMGLGKTVQAFVVALCYAPEDWPLLVITPSSVKSMWKGIIEDWMPKVEPYKSLNNIVVVSKGDEVERAIESKPDVVVISHDLAKMSKHAKVLKAYKFKMIIADESHMLKSIISQRTLTISSLVKQATRAVLLTGTPVLNRPIEWFPQLEMLKPGLFGSLYDFGMRYCNGYQSEIFEYGTPGCNGMDFSGHSNLVELNQKLERTILLRRTKRMVQNDLPKKQRTIVRISMDPTKASDVEQTLIDIKQLSRQHDLGLINEQQFKQSHQQLITQLYFLTGRAKVDHAIQHITSLINNGEKVLVFAHHIEVLDKLQSHLLQPNGPYSGIRIDGSVTDKKRKKLVDDFQNEDKGHQVALLSITAAGVGITLTAAARIVFVELHWTPALLLQCEDRAHRIGQMRDVCVEYLLTEAQSADSLIWKAISNKLDVVNSTMGDNNVLNAFRHAEEPGLEEYRSLGSGDTVAREEKDGEGEVVQEVGLVAALANAGVDAAGSIVIDDDQNNLNGLGSARRVKPAAAAVTKVENNNVSSSRNNNDKKTTMTPKKRSNIIAPSDDNDDDGDDGDDYVSYKKKKKTPKKRSHVIESSEDDDDYDVQYTQQQQEERRRRRNVKRGLKTDTNRCCRCDDHERRRQNQAEECSTENSCNFETAAAEFKLAAKLNTLIKQDYSGEQAFELLRKQRALQDFHSALECGRLDTAKRWWLMFPELPCHRETPTNLIESTATFSQLYAIRNAQGKRLVDISIGAHLGEALFLAIRYAEEDWVRYLLDAGADPNAFDKDGKTTLMVASCYTECTAIVKLLLKAGANPNAPWREYDGSTALIPAVINGFTATVALLLKAGANPNVSNKYGLTALRLAASNGYMSIVDLLRQANAEVNPSAERPGFV